MDQELIVCFQIFVSITSDVLQNHAGPLLVSSPLTEAGDTPTTPTISRHVSVILMKWPEGSHHLGRCQITYHSSHLNKGRTSILTWRTLTLPPHPLSSMPQITEPSVPLGTWCDAYAEPHLHRSWLESSQIITSTSGSFSIIHILLKNKILQIPKYSTQSSVPLWQSGTVYLPLAKTGEISIATEAICKQGLWL